MLGISLEIDMLLDTQIKPQDIASIKFSNGDEIIAKIVDVEGPSITVTKPLAMMLTRDPRSGQPGIQMAPLWILGADVESRFPILKSHITCMVKASTEAAKGYTANTTGLTIPSGSGLVG
jgi:hypothetical protein